MPTVSNVNLTLSDSGGQVRATVTYDVDVTPFERQLVGLGAEYHSHIALHDFDGGDGVGAALAEFPRGSTTESHLDITVGSGIQTLPKSQSALFPRFQLKGDAPNNDDEIKANVRIHTESAQVAFTSDVLSDQEILAD
jgi:hypothetical protein